MTGNNLYPEMEQGILRESADGTFLGQHYPFTASREFFELGFCPYAVVLICQIE